MSEDRIFSVDSEGTAEASPHPEVKETRPTLIIQVDGHEIPLPTGAQAAPSESGRWYFIDRANHRLCDASTGEWTQLDPTSTVEDFLKDK